MDALEELGEINKKAAKFLHFHDFDEKHIEKMIEDLQSTHPNEHSIAESREIFENILKDPVLIDRIKSRIKEEAEFYIKYEQEQGASLLPVLMQEEDIKKRLEKSRFNEENALLAWFYRLFPRYTLQQITAYHRQTLNTMNRINFGKLGEAEQSQIVRIAELVIEYYEFDVENRLDEMVQDLLVKALHVPQDNRNITPQFCRSVLLNVDVDDLKLCVENEFKEPRNVVKDKHIKRAYRILQMKNICNRAHKTVRFPDRGLLLKQVFFDYNERYKFTQLRDRVQQYCDELEASPTGNVAGRAGNVAGAPKPGTSGVQQTTRDKPDVSKRDESSKTEASPNRKTITYVMVDEGPIMRKVEISTLPTRSSTSPTKSSTSPTKSTTSPTKSSTSPTKSTTSPTKSTTSPTKSTTSPTTSTTSSSIPMRSPPIRLRSPPTTMRSPPTTMRSPPITIRSSPTTMQSPRITIRSEGSNLPSTTSAVTETSPKRLTRTPPRLIARTVPRSPPKEKSKSPPKGTKRTFKSPDKEAVDHQPKKTKPSDDEIAEPQLKKPEE